MSCGLLPEIDKYILSFERWLVVEHLPTLAGDAHRLIREFATWHVLPALRRRAGTRRLTPNTRRMAGSETKRAAAFLAWLDAHGRAAAPRPTSTAGTPNTAATSTPSCGRSYSGPCAPDAWPAWTSPVMRRPGGRRSPSTTGSVCCAACSPTTPPRSGHGWPRC